jgi:hypothetical protein
VPWGSHFCANCGRPVGAETVVACEQCGHPLPADARFCASCGHAAELDEGAPAETAPETESEAEPEAQAAEPEAEPEDQEEPVSEETIMHAAVGGEAEPDEPDPDPWER